MMDTMTALHPHHTATAICAAMLALGLSACNVTSVPGPGEDAEITSLDPTASPGETMNEDHSSVDLEAQQRLLEKQAPAIAETIGASRVKFLRQTDCNGETDPYKMGSKVQWTTTIGHRVPDLGAAVTAGDDVRRYLERHGWTVHVAESLRPEAPANTLFNAEHSEMHMRLTAEYDHGGGDSELWIRSGGPCVDMPTGNRMVRSHLDSGFGSPQPEYDSEAERRSPQYQEYSLPPGEKPGPVTDEPGPDRSGASPVPGPATPADR